MKLEESRREPANAGVSLRSVELEVDSNASLSRPEAPGNPESRSSIPILALALSSIHSLRGWPMALTLMTIIPLVVWFVLQQTKLRKMRQLRRIPYFVLLFNVLYIVSGWLSKSAAF